MNDKEMRQLALALARCDRADQVINLLKKHKLWDDMSCWKPLGGNENNYSIALF